MTDAELVDTADHPDDYEPWAVELGRTELQRRALAPHAIEEMRAENAAAATEAAPPSILESVVSSVAHPILISIGIIFFPLLLYVAYRYRLAGRPRQGAPFFVGGLLIGSMWVFTAIGIAVHHWLGK